MSSTESIGRITQHLSAVQAAIDAARRLGQTITAPVIGREGAAPHPLPHADAVMRGHADGSGLASGRAGSVSGPGGAPEGRFDALIREASAREGIDATLVKAVAQAESSLNPNAVSPAGAKGLMQLMDATARSLGVADPFDPVQNVAGGAKYLKQLLSRYGGDVRRALAAYNAGPGTVDRYGGIPPYAETQTYVQRVLQLRDRLHPPGGRSAINELASLAPPSDL